MKETSEMHDDQRHGDRDELEEKEETQKRTKQEKRKKHLISAVAESVDAESDDDGLLIHWPDDDAVS
jgi:nucleosome binding factor SPN SPT16 subunit